MRGSFRPAFFAALGLSLGLSLGTGERLFVQMTLFLLAACVLLAAHMLITLYIVIFKQELSAREAVKGDDVSFSIRAYNETFIPVAPIEIAYADMDALLGGPPRTAALFPPPRGEDGVGESWRCPYRGEYRPGVVSVTVQDALGIFRMTLPARFLTHIQPASLLVRPRVYALHSSAVPLFPREGLHDPSADSADDVTAISDLRRFRPGDPLKRTHWKLSARLRQTMVKEFEGTSVRDLALVLDARPPAFESLKRLQVEDALVEAAVALCHLCVRGVPVRLIAYAKSRLELRATRSIDFDAAYEALSHLRFEGEYGVKDILTLEIAKRADVGGVAVVTPLLDDALFDCLLTMCENGQSPLLIAVLPHEDRDALFEKKLAQLSARGARAVALAPGETIPRTLKAGKGGAA